MIFFAGLLVGAIWGAIVARKRGGNRLDQAQYAAGFGLAFGIIGLLVTVIVDRLVAGG